LDPRKTTDDQVNEDNEINENVVDDNRERGAEHPRTVS
jgi:hypothetical protein